MGAYIKIDGVHQQVKDAYVKISGVWKRGSTILTRVNGAWVLVWRRAFPTPTYLTYPSSTRKGESFTWTTEPVIGASYELQVCLNGGAWGASQFFINNSNSYTPPANIPYQPNSTLQLRVRAVDTDDHSSPSEWFTGIVASLNTL